MVVPKLLNVSNAKTSKGEKLGYLTGVLYLLPADSAGLGNLCPLASPGCIAACLVNAGRIEMEGPNGNIRKARLNRTVAFMKHRELFLTQLRREISNLVKLAGKKGLIPAIRLNGTSDVAMLPVMLAKEFPTVQFYDYTKIPFKPNDFRTRITNYSLTFSRSEINEESCIEVLKAGGNVAVAFSTKRGHELPKTWNGYTVIDGDLSDLRFLDAKGVVVGLRSKGGKHRKTQETNNNPFIVRVA